MMLGHYGWIKPLEDIDDEAISKNDGNIYVDALDISGGAHLPQGQLVGFYVYVDELGLQAEGVRCLKKGDGSQSKVCLESSAAELVPFGSNASLPNLCYTQGVFAINLSYFSDDSSDEDDSDCEQILRIPIGKNAKQRSLSPVASTASGLSSDDEVDSDSTPGIEDLPEACLRGKKFQPPPGLCLSSPPSQFTMGILTRAGLPVKPEQQKEQQPSPAWRPDGKAKPAASESKKAWIPAWKRAQRSVATS